jgi:tetratricopeptide (TPR) repeat protein
MAKGMQESELRSSASALWRIGVPVGIFLLALVLRGIAIFQLADTPFFKGLIIDGREYYDWGLRIAQGQLLWNEPLFRAPLYPYLLAIILMCFGSHVVGIYVVQALLGAVNCVLIYWLGAALLGRRVGAVAGIGAALYSQFIYFGARVETVTLVIFLNLLFILALLRAMKKWEIAWWIVVGVLLGLSALARATILLLLPVLMIWIVVACRGPASRRWACLAALFVATACIVGPVIARNSHLDGNIVGIAASGGINFYKGNNAHYEKVLAIRPGYAWDRLAYEQVWTGEAQGIIKSSGYFFRKGLRFIATQPLAYVLLVGKKLLIFLNAYEISDNEHIGFIQSHLGIFRLPLLGYGVVCPLALVGLVLSFLRRDRIGVLYLMCGFYLVAVAVLFFVTARYRLPIVPYLLILASGTIFWLVDQLKLQRSPSDASRSRQDRAFRSSRSVVFVVVGIVVATLVVNLDLIGRQRYNFTRPHLLLAQVLHDEKDYEEALRELDKAAEQKSEDPDIHFARAKVYEARGDDTRAIRELEQSCERAPDYVEATIRLGALLGKTGDLERASQLLQHALILAPSNAKVRYYLGLLALEQGDVEQAIAELEQAKRLTPPYYEIHFQLGMIYAQMGNDAGALRELMAAAELNPISAEVQESLGVALYAMGKYAHARTAWQRCLQLNREQPRVHYNLACAEAMLGNTARALSHLEQALRKGYRDYASIAENPDLASLRNELAFQELLRQLRDESLENVPQ